MNVEDLSRELRKLQRGEGMGAADLDQYVGPILRTVCHADPTDDQDTLRTRLADLITRHAATLPENVRRAVLASLALHPDAPFRFLKDRQKWALGPMNRDSPRTVDRTTERGLRRIAEEIIAEYKESQERPPNPFAPRGFYTAELTATVRLDLDPPEWWERRRIVALDQGLDRVPVSVSVPAAPDGSFADIELEVTDGGTLLDWTRAQPAHYQGWIQLDRRLARTEHYEYEVRRRISRADAVQPYYIVSPHVRCDRLVVHIDLGSAGPAWKVDGVPWPTLEDGTIKLLPPLPVDASGRVTVEFSHLDRGLAYGTVWDGT
jgi:hypothetical protein